MADLEVIRPGEQWFSPADQLREGAKGIRYLLRAPTLYDKTQLAAAIARRGARPVAPPLVAYTVRQALEALRSGGGLTDAEAALYTELLDRVDHAGGRAGELLSRDDSARYMHLLGVLRRHYPPLAELEAQQQEYAQIEELETVRFLLRGWENVETEAGPVAWQAALDGGTAPDLLDLLPDSHRIAIALRLMQLRRPDGMQLKNSRPPSSGRSTPTSSTAAKSGPSKTRRQKARGGNSRLSASS